MTQSALTKERYLAMVKEAEPKSGIFLNCFKAFLAGGAICALAQLLYSWLLTKGFSRDMTGMLTSVAFVFAGALLTGLGVYDKLGKFGGAGTIVPITGFANSIAAPAVEFKKEGLIYGVGARIFSFAGSVILYGTLASVLVGVIKFLWVR